MSFAIKKIRKNACAPKCKIREGNQLFQRFAPLCNKYATSAPPPGSAKDRALQPPAEVGTRKNVGQKPKSRRKTPKALSDDVFAHEMQQEGHQSSFRGIYGGWLFVSISNDGYDVPWLSTCGLDLAQTVRRIWNETEPAKIADY